MSRRSWLGGWIATAALVLAACSSTSPTPTARPTTAVVASASPSPGRCTEDADPTGAVATEIKDFAFQSGLTVKAGGAITWTNADSTGHTVTFDNSMCGSNKIDPGTSVTFGFNVPGTFTFHCAIHPNMKGTLTVTD